jgi:hypothetical protein
MGAATYVRGAYKGLAGDRASMIDYQSDDQPGGKHLNNTRGQLSLILMVVGGDNNMFLQVMSLKGALPVLYL